MRAIRAYELPSGVRFSAYENKRGNLNIKMEIPSKATRDNISFIVPVGIGEQELCGLFDSFINDNKGKEPAEIKQAFTKLFIYPHAIY